MKYLDARMDLPPDLRHPMDEFLRTEEHVTRVELLAWNIIPQSVEYILAQVEGNIEPYREKIRRVDSVRDVTLQPIDDASFYAYVCQETREADELWREAFVHRNLVIVPPLVYDDSGMQFTVVGASEDLQGLLEDIPDRIEVSVEEIGDYDRRHATLATGVTDRQIEAVRAAVELGYYAVPREASLQEVGDALDCAESTASNLLRKAESSVMRRLVDWV